MYFYKVEQYKCSNTRKYDSANILVLSSVNTKKCFMLAHMKFKIVDAVTIFSVYR